MPPNSGRITKPGPPAFQTHRPTPPPAKPKKKGGTQTNFAHTVRPDPSSRRKTPFAFRTNIHPPAGLRPHRRQKPVPGKDGSFPYTARQRASAGHGNTPEASHPFSVQRAPPEAPLGGAFLLHAPGVERPSNTPPTDTIQNPPAARPAPGPHLPPAGT